MGTVQAKDLQPEDRSSGPDFSESAPSLKPEKEIVLADIPAKVEKIHIKGVTRTKNDVLTKHLQDIFTADNFEQMVRKAQIGKIQLERLGLFKKIIIAIDVGTEAGRTDGYDVTYEVEEHRRVTGGISTLIGTNEGSLVLTVKMPNSMGRGERFNAQYMFGTKKNLGYTVDFTKPLQADPNLNFSASLSRQYGEVPQCGYSETIRGGGLDLSFPTLLGNHSVRWEGLWRELNCLNNTTAFAVREQAGHSLKSLLRHTWIRDSRDDRIIPNSGYYMKAMQELAGLGGDAHYVKHEMELQLNKSLLWDSVLQLSLAGGLMKTIRPCSDINIQDRFFLGGPLTLRGFNLKGAGPHEDGCALGGDTYWCAGLHLYTPLPFRPGKGGFGDLFRTHFFATAGNLRNLNLNDEWRENMRKLGETLRCSYGLGLVLRMGGIARMELNYCIPVQTQKGDSVNHGLQFGIGIHFL